MALKVHQDGFKPGKGSKCVTLTRQISKLEHCVATPKPCIWRKAHFAFGKTLHLGTPQNALDIQQIRNLSLSLHAITAKSSDINVNQSQTINPE
jgi:hypothetical protein